MPYEGVPVRDGATVVVARDGADGIEVLLLRRSEASIFMPGAQCFPGGRVDDADGDDVEDACRRAVVREAFEEAGLLLGASAAIATGFDADRWRADVYAGRARVDDAAGAAGVTLDASVLRPLSRWVTPPGDTRRYDTRFFVAPAPAGQEPTCDGVELVDCGWWAPLAALRAARERRLFVIQPTLHTLATVGRFDSVPSLLDALDGADPDDRIVEADNGWRLRLPFDPVPAAVG